MLTAKRLKLARIQRTDGEPGGVGRFAQMGWACTIKQRRMECSNSGRAVIIDGEPTWEGEAICAEHADLIAPPATTQDATLPGLRDGR